MGIWGFCRYISFSIYSPFLFRINFILVYSGLVNDIFMVINGISIVGSVGILEYQLILLFFTILLLILKYVECCLYSLFKKFFLVCWDFHIIVSVAFDIDFVVNSWIIYILSHYVVFVFVEWSPGYSYCSAKGFDDTTEISFFSDIFFREFLLFVKCLAFLDK